VSGEAGVAELAVLRAVRLKLIASTDQVATMVGVDAGTAAAALAGVAAAGQASETPRGWRLTPDGQARLQALLDDERAAVDTTTARSVHTRFVAFDARLKDLVTSHQLSADTTVAPERVAGLGALHDDVGAVVADATAVAPRLAPYAGRLDAAHAALVEGDARFLAHPLVDSYHTVWFELHEELIHLAGLDRSQLDQSHAPS
jgi:pyruvate, orthophosphate dikinase